MRGALLLKPESSFALARELRSASGAAVGSVFSFVSGLYFRGKATYATAFGSAPPGLASALVISAGGGLLRLDERVTLQRLRGWMQVSIHEANPHFTAPLLRHASEQLDAHAAETRFVLLGSVASNKYVGPLLEVFGERLLFPSEFAGRGDMSRGALLLRAVREERELAYTPVLGAIRSHAAPSGRRRG
jgi:hypothetical protein